MGSKQVVELKYGERNIKDCRSEYKGKVGVYRIRVLCTYIKGGGS